MARVQNEIIWGDTRQELIDSGIEPTDIKSVTFIASTLQDNKILMEKDPSYMANLKALPIVEKERLLYGNWKIKAAAGLFYQRTQVTMIETLPNDIYLWARGWDLSRYIRGREMENRHIQPEFLLVSVSVDAGLSQSHQQAFECVGSAKADKDYLSN